MLDITYLVLGVKFLTEQIESVIRLWTL